MVLTISRREISAWRANDVHFGREAVELCHMNEDGTSDGDGDVSIDVSSRQQHGQSAAQPNDKRVVRARNNLQSNSPSNMFSNG